MWVGRAEQLSEILHCWFSGSQKNNTSLVRAFYFWTLCCSVLALLTSTVDWSLHFFFVRVASRRLCSALVSTLDSTKYIRCEGPATLSSPSSITKKRCPPYSILHRHPCIMHVSVSLIPRPRPAFRRMQYEATFQWHPIHGSGHKLTFRAWPQIDIPKQYRKLTFLSMTDTHVRTYIHMYIARIDPSLKASC